MYLVLRTNKRSLEFLRDEKKEKEKLREKEGVLLWIVGKK